jgi:hypothetical protein
MCMHMHMHMHMHIMHMQAGLPAGDPEVAVSLKQRHAHFAINQLMVDDLCAPPVTRHTGLQPHRIWVVRSDGLEATKGRANPWPGRGLGPCTAPGGARVWSFAGRTWLRTAICAPPCKALNVIRRELLVDRRRARQRCSRLLLRKGNVFKLLVPPN